ncbi:hypothetical protein AB4Y38_24400 [Paraburkholderia sp. EG285A]|uniref:hypothetical protein n=1 Tax=Paraburkholderia sp. EG285A TaxID=3237009 RepID=UPI0034D1F436
MGAKEAARGLRHAEESEVRVSHAIMDLLARTAAFEDHGHDGRSTMAKLATVDAVRNILISKLGVSPSTIAYYPRNLSLPNLSVLAAVAVVSRQPLHHVILGQVVPWKESSLSNSRINATRGRSRRNWKAIERKFEKYANDPSCANVENACKKMGLNRYFVQRKFPDLFARIVQRGRILRSEMAETHQRARLEKMRNAFRTLLAAGEYPSQSKLCKISAVDTRHLDRDRFKDLLDEEWLRAEGKTHLRRQRSRNPRFNRNRL